MATHDAHPTRISAALSRIFSAIERAGEMAARFQQTQPDSAALAGSDESGQASLTVDETAHRGSLPDG